MVKDETRHKIDQLLWDRRIIAVPDHIPSPVTSIIMRNSTLQERSRASFLHDAIYEQCIQAGVPTEDVIIEDAIKVGHWDNDKEAFLHKVDEDIDFWQQELGKQQFAARQKTLRRRIDKLISSKDELSQTRNDLLVMTAEYLANEAYTFYLLRCIVRTFEDEALWESEEAFFECKKQYCHFVHFACSELLSGGFCDIPTIRSVARSGEWRLLWVSSRDNLGVLFGIPASDINISQKLLVYWSRVYDSVFEDPDRPQDDVIEDDDRLDGWLKNRDVDRREKRSGIDKPNKGSTKDHTERMVILDGHHIDTCTCGVGDIHVKGLGERPVHDAGCPWGTWVPYTEEEKEEMAQQIYGRNPAAVRSLLGREQDQVEKEGVITEQKLRGRKVRQFLGMEQRR